MFLILENADFSLQSFFSPGCQQKCLKTYSLHPIGGKHISNFDIGFSCFDFIACRKQVFLSKMTK